jgi:hypothetical protein
MSFMKHTTANPKFGNRINVKRYKVFRQMRSLFLKQDLSPAHFQSAEIIPGV